MSSALPPTGLRERAGHWGRAVHRGASFDVVVGVGLVTYGIVYLLVAGTAVHIAVTGERSPDTPYAALDSLAETVGGEALLWVTALGLAALTVWQVFETVWRRDPLENPIGRAFGRVGSTLSAVGYLALGISAGRAAVVGRATRQGRRPAAPDVSATEVLVVRVLVVVGGVVLLALGVRAVYRGARRRFVGDLRDGARRWVVGVGQVGYVGKGVTFGIIGGLMIAAAVSDRVGPPGLQTAVRMVNLSPSGGILLWLKAIGFAVFGAYCLAWAANRRR